jgi:hypothetical protein
MRLTMTSDVDAADETAGGLQRTEMWETTSAPADNSGSRDAAEAINHRHPAAAGTI